VGFWAHLCPCSLLVALLREVSVSHASRGAPGQGPVGHRSSPLQTGRDAGECRALQARREPTWAVYSQGAGLQRARARCIGFESVAPPMLGFLNKPVKRSSDSPEIAVQNYGHKPACRPTSRAASENAPFPGGAPIVSPLLPMGEP
jgi:hypothetical protein